MPKKAITGWRKVKQGKNVRYVNQNTGEDLSYRQYVKRTEGVRSLEAKAKALAKVREIEGKKKPMARYNAVVTQWKETYGEDAKVKGNSPEAKKFQRLYQELKMSRAGKKGEKRRLRVLHELGVITDAQYERYG